jgi:hypothetical protein
MTEWNTAELIEADPSSPRLRRGSAVPKLKGFTIEWNTDQLIAWDPPPLKPWRGFVHEETNSAFR